MGIKVWDNSPSILHLTIFNEPSSSVHSSRRHLAVLAVLFLTFIVALQLASPQHHFLVRGAIALLASSLLSIFLSPSSPPPSSSTLTFLRSCGVSVSPGRLSGRSPSLPPPPGRAVDFAPVTAVRGAIVNEAFGGVGVETYLAFVLGDEGKLLVASPLGAKERDVTEAYGLVIDWMDGNGLLPNR